VEKELSLPGDKKASDIIRKVITNKYEDEFSDIAASGASFADAFANAPADDEEEATESTLRDDMQSFRNGLRETPVPAHAAGVDEVLPTIPGDEDSELIAKLHKQVIVIRKNLIQFIATNQFATQDYWKKGGQATMLYQRSKFAQSSGEAAVAGKQNSMIMLNAELFPTKEVFASPTPHKDPVPMTPDLKSAAKWVMAAQGNNTICVLADGRSKKVRRAFEDIVDECQTDEQKHLDGYIVYAAPSSNDVRFHKRKTFGGLSNLEKLTGTLPVPRVRMTSKERTHFSACGEKSTFASSYTNVTMRDVERLSRLSIQDKEGVIAGSLPAYGEKVTAATGAKGHPLFWSEVKTIEVYVALFKDMNASHIFDVAAGSAAAAIAAAICNIGYEGLALNASHAAWLNRIIDKAMFAIIADRTDEESKQLRTDLATYFGPSIEEARKLLAVDKQETDGEESDEDDEEDEEGAIGIGR
jgi:hypothetical protein